MQMPIQRTDLKIENRNYWGTGFADDVEQRMQNLMIGAATKVQEMSQDQEGITDDALRLIGGGIKNVQAAAADQEGITDDLLRLAGGGIKNTLKIAGLTGEIGGWAGGKLAGALGVDPRIGRTIGGFAGDAVTLGGTVKALKIGSKLTGSALNKTTGIVPRVRGLKHLITKGAPEAGAGIKIGGKGVVKRTPTSALIKEQLKDLDPRLAKRDVAKRYADQPIFIKELDQLNTKVQKWYDGPGKGRLAGFPKEGRTITAPDGIKYRVRDSNKAGGTGKFSINQDISARNTAQIRKIAQGPDQRTLAKQFEKWVPKNQVNSAVESYTKTNKKVYNALTAARKRYNVGKPKAEHATIEHIFDVDFHKRLKDEAVKGFSGKGADELWNLKMIDYALNSKTGALNKKAKDMGQVLIDAVRKDEFIDYNQVVKDFVDNNLGSKIAKLKPKDWDIITEYSMKNPKLNMQQILLEYTKGK